MQESIQREQQTSQSNYGDEEADRGSDYQKKGTCNLIATQGYFIYPKNGKLSPARM